MKLYRFEKFEKKRCETIANNKLWLSAPSEFNDLDDCRIKALYHQPFTKKESDIIIDAINLFYPLDTNYENTILTKKIIDNLKKFVSPKNILDSPGAVVAIREELSRTTGVCCFFSGISDNSLMWAHYADSHKGFCIEYELDEKSNSELIEVTYASKLPMPSATEIIFSPTETLTRILTTKSIHWQYEKEWRIVHLKALCSDKNEKGTLIERPDILKPSCIILGAKFNKENMAIIEKMAQSLNIKIYGYKIFYYNY